MLTARGDAMDRIVGLELGADDYLPKPFEPRELLARSHTQKANRREILEPRAALRPPRSRPGCPLGARRRKEKPLTSFQFALLVALAENAGRVLSREALMDLVKGEKLDAFDRSIDVHVSRIRAAIEDDPKKPRRIITVRGAGTSLPDSRPDAQALPANLLRGPREPRGLRARRGSAVARRRSRAKAARSPSSRAMCSRRRPHRPRSSRPRSSAWRATCL